MIYLVENIRLIILHPTNKDIDVHNIIYKYEYTICKITDLFNFNFFLYVYTLQTERDIKKESQTVRRAGKYENKSI